MKIPFVGPSNTANSKEAAFERSVNVYLEKNSDPQRPWALYGTPGQTLRATLGVAAPRGAIEMGSLTYWVSGNTVYKMDSNYTATSLGTIGTSSGRVGLATNGDEVLIVDGDSGWLATSTTLTEIADVDFPSGVTVALYLDSYFLVFGDGTQRLYWNETPGSGSAWNGLDFSSAEGSPDILRGGVVDNRTAWLVGSKSAELWRTTSDADAPLQRMDGVFIEHGTASGWTVAKMDNAVYWLSESDSGDGIVLRSGGSAPQRVSSHSLEYAISRYSTIADAFAFTMQFQGHSWYVLTFPTADATWFYDAASDNWFEWLWFDSANNEFHRHRANCHVFANRKHLIGDWETGEVYSLEADVYTDNGDTIKRVRRTQTLSAGGKSMFFGELVIDIETGVANADCAAPVLMFSYYHNPNGQPVVEKQASLGAVGEYGKGVRFISNGSGKSRVWEVALTDPVKFAMFGADVDVEAGR